MKRLRRVFPSINLKIADVSIHTVRVHKDTLPPPPTLQASLEGTALFGMSFSFSVETRFGVFLYNAHHTGNYYITAFVWKN